MYTEYTKRLISLLDLGENERKAELAKLVEEFNISIFQAGLSVLI